MSHGPGNATATMRLLKAVAGELRELAYDTARFGENLTDHGKIAGSDESIRLLQKFDLFSQSLQAHAILIDALSGRINNGPIETVELNELLHHVPFFSVRERLRAMVTGEDNAQKEDEPSEDFWFLNE
jgi:hypothetical protein